MVPVMPLLTRMCAYFRLSMKILATVAGEPCEEYEAAGLIEICSAQPEGRWRFRRLVHTTEVWGH